MKCPIDQAELVMSERQGIEIDYCPKCRGVWLDRGELDKIIERSGSAQGPSQQAPVQQAPDSYRAEPQRPHGHDHDRGYGHQQKPYYKKKKSFLDDIFDF